MGSVLEDDYSDLIELGIDINETDILTSKFNKCVKHVQSIAGTLNNDILLRLYGFYKQSIEGSCNIPKPSWYDMRGKAKWEAWNSLGDMTAIDAKAKYINLVLEVSPNFVFEETESWVKVSSLAHEFTLDKDICDFIRNGDEEKVREHLICNGSCKNSLDDQGVGLMHYASDIGNFNILQLLIDNGSDVNLQDSEGQTPLHYAASCGHADCVNLLLSHSARIDIVDAEGCTAAEIACDSVKGLLNAS